LVISAASIERFLKWGAVPLALVVAFFVSRYSDDILGRSDTGGELTSPRAGSPPHAGFLSNWLLDEGSLSLCEKEHWKERLF